MERTLIKKHLEQIEKFDSQRKNWLRLSAFVVITILGIIWDWRHIQEYNLTWWIGSAGLIVAVLWWYWTMIVIRLLLTHRVHEAELLYEIVSDIKEIKKDIQER